MKGKGKQGGTGLQGKKLEYVQQVPKFLQQHAQLLSQGSKFGRRNEVEHASPSPSLSEEDEIEYEKVFRLNLRLNAPLVGD